MSIKRMQKSFSLAVQYAAEDVVPANLPSRPQFRRWVSSALEQAAEITLRIVDEWEGRTLNHDYRGKDYATNVLTFVYDDTEPLSGDIVLCAAVVEREAQQQQKKLLAHYAHLTVHGVLHLQGYDHVNDDEAAIMEQKEIALLEKMGFNNPYTEDNCAEMAN